MRRLSGLLLLTCVLSASCGGGGGGDGDGGPNPAPATTLYVRQSGDDDADGRSPETAFRTVVRAAQFLAPGVTIFVGPGIYEGSIDITGIEGTSDASPVELIADSSGEETGDAPGEVVLDADGGPFAVRVSRTEFFVIDGFIVVGANAGETAIQVRSRSHSAVIRNCVITNGGPADGIRVQNSNDALVFNNLIFDNNRGIRVGDGAQNARIINNSIVDNRGTGIAIGGANAENVPSSGATVLNNIIQASGNNVSIAVEDGPPSSRDGYVGNFNLAFAPDLGDQTKTYRPSVIQGEDDINENAQLVDIPDGDFHLLPDSPARNAGTGSIGSELLAVLFSRSTSSNEQLDTPPVDMGYHYLVIEPTPGEEP